VRTLVDPDTGELVEVLPGDVSETDPYSYEQAKRAVMGATREKRDALRRYEAAIAAKASAEKDYLVKKARAMERMRPIHGATMAEDMAKGEPEVAEAFRVRDEARDMVHAWRARLLLSSEDRASLNRLMEWSREADPNGWRTR
jgi:hypothetical protein